MKKEPSIMKQTKNTFPSNAFEKYWNLNDQIALSFARAKDILQQIETEIITFEILDNGKKKNFSFEKDRKVIFPQEFKVLIKLNVKFEFLGWWKGNCNTWYLDIPLEEADNLNNNMFLLRRK